jgi:hypothetical protein
MLDASLVISEFLASNSGGLQDENGESSDWIEIFNPTSSAVNLQGWHLTDDSSNLSKWTFPSTTLEAGGYQVVFASGKNRTIPGQPLHTNFSLDKDGEYLALVEPDGVTTATAFSPAYPAQRENISYGPSQLVTDFVEQGSSVKVHVANQNESLGTTWTGTSYNDASWQGNSPIVITEVNSASTDWIEIQNVTASAASTAGWKVAVNIASGSNINSVTSTLWSLPSSISANQILYRTADSGDSSHYWGTSLSLTVRGWVMIVTDTGQVADFVAWGYSAAQLATLNVTVNGFNINSSTWNAWAGAPYITSSSVATLQRGGSIDTNSATDWKVAAASQGTANASLATPLAASATSGIGYISTDSNFTATRIQATSSITSLDQAEAVIADGALARYTENVSTINYYNTGDAARFDSDRPFPGTSIGNEAETFVMLVTGKIIIPSAGTYTFGVNSDDGFRLTLTGASGTFTSYYPDLRGTSDTFGVFDIGTPGIYDVRLIMYENYGGSCLEFFAARGNYSTFTDDFHLVGDYAHGGIATTGMGDNVLTNVQQQMQDVNASVLTRYSFNVADAALYSALKMNVKYNDGFVAYLNGVEIARRNAPATIAWNSAATSIPAQYSWIEEEINLSAYLNLLSSGANVLAIQGLNSSSGTTDFLLSPKLIGIGSDETIAMRYFGEPTPGEPNAAESYDGFVAEPTFSVAHGFFTASFPLQIASATPGASIYYTLDGSDPSPTNGTLYTGTMTISQTIVLRAAAFKTGYYPANAATETYLFTADVIQQSSDGSAPADWPTGPINGQILDYGMDPDIVNSATWGPQVETALKSIPTISIVTDLDNLFDPNTGIYVHSWNDGRDWEREASVELINPDGTVGFQIDAGLRVRGGYSRSTDNPKHAFRLFFRSEYGESKLEYPMFGEGGMDVFDKIDFRCSQNYSWSFGGDSRNAVIRDIFARDTQAAMGDLTSHGKPYHLYINGQYWGLYETDERPEANFAASYLGGKSEDYDVIKVEAGSYNIYATDGTVDAWWQLWTLATAGFSTNDAYYRALGKNLDGTRNPSYPVYVDQDNLIDYMLLTFYNGNLDAPVSAFLGNSYPNNFYAIYNRNGEGGFKFVAHDSEHTLKVADDTYGGISNRTLNFPAGDTFETSNPQWLHQQLMANPEYRMRFADRVQKFCFNGGVLTPTTAQNRYNARANQINMAIIAESARWGDSKVSTPYTKADWQTAVNADAAWMSTRPTYLLGQLRTTTLRDGTSAPLFPMQSAPNFSKRGGNVVSGFLLGLTSDAAIYYTTDGSDPRLSGGAIGPTAILYSGSIAITDTTLIRVRALSGTTWSALDEAQFIVGMPASISNLTVSEIHYHAPDPTAAELAHNSTWTNDSFDYVEFKNIGTTNIDLTGVKFTAGVTYDFTGSSITTLAPGEYVVVAKSLEAFSYRYGTSMLSRVAGTYSGNLANGGETLTLVGYSGVQIFTFAYDDEGAWPTRPDGDGSSLDLINPAAVPKTAAARTTYLQNAANWRASGEYGGSIGAAGIGPLNGVVINEVLPHTDLPNFDSIELYNTTASPIDIGGWYLSDTSGNLEKYRIPAGTIIGAHQYLVLTEQQFGISAYSSATEDGDGDATNLDSGTTLLLQQNTWRKIALPYAVTANTVLEFDYLSTTRGEWQGIGFDGDDSASPDRLFRLYGTETWGISSYADYASSAPGWKHYAIPVGAFYTGAMNYLAFINDDDAENEATSYFKNVVVHEGTAGATIDFRRYFSLSSKGDDVWLMKTDAEGKIAYFADNVAFGASANGESFGRWPNGTGILYPMKNRTFGDANDIGGNGPRIGPLVISEVMYKPSVSGSEVADDLEYVEIFNPTDSAVSLANWQIGSGVTFAFSSTTTLAAHRALVVLPFGPSLEANATKLSNFRTKYGIDASVPLVGPYAGHLSDAGATVQLLRPDDPEGTPPTYPALLEDEVTYGIASPWPTAANGGGSSLQRKSADSWGIAASSWVAATPTVGTARVSSVAGRRLFYDNSAYDGLVAGISGADDLAIAVNKNALLPGQTASFANYTNSSKGINGLMVDLRFAADKSLIDLTDFQFRVGNNNSPSGWSLLAGSQLPTLVVRPGTGVDGTDRIEFVWNDASAIKNQWLQVTILATDHTGLRSPDVFYFGNLVGETGNVAGEASVTVLDEQQTRSHRSYFSLVDISNGYDFNLDRKVNAADEYLARSNAGASLTMLTIPAAAAAAEVYAPIEETAESPADPTASTEGEEEAVETIVVVSEDQNTGEDNREIASTAATETDSAVVDVPQTTPALVVEVTLTTTDEFAQDIVTTTIDATSPPAVEYLPIISDSPTVETIAEIATPTAIAEPETPDIAPSSVAQLSKRYPPLKPETLPVPTAPARAEYFAEIAENAKISKSTFRLESPRGEIRNSLQLPAAQRAAVARAFDSIFASDDSSQTENDSPFDGDLSSDKSLKFAFRRKFNSMRPRK